MIKPFICLLIPAVFCLVQATAEEKPAARFGGLDLTALYPEVPQALKSLSALAHSADVISLTTIHYNPEAARKTVDTLYVSVSRGEVKMLTRILENGEEKKPVKAELDEGTADYSVYLKGNGAAYVLDKKADKWRRTLVAPSSLRYRVGKVLNFIDRGTNPTLQRVVRSQAAMLQQKLAANAIPEVASITSDIAALKFATGEVSIKMRENGRNVRYTFYTDRDTGSVASVEKTDDHGTLLHREEIVLGAKEPMGLVAAQVEETMPQLPTADPQSLPKVFGIQVERKAEGLVVVHALSGFPAAKCGIKPGDIVEALDRKSVDNMTSDDFVSELRGRESVIINILREAKRLEFIIDKKEGLGGVIPDFEDFEKMFKVRPAQEFENNSTRNK